MSRIADKFLEIRKKKKKALIPFFTAGDPSPECTVEIMLTLVEAGADIIELGVPFSDPIADGPVIQRSSERALKSGVNLKQVLEFVRKFREHDQITPLVLMGYGNPIEAMGYSEFAGAAKKAGVDGVLVVDYPPEEGRALNKELVSNGIDSIFLLAPTSTMKRIKDVAKIASGYIYYVSLRGVTGAKNIDIQSVAERLPLIKSMIDLPVGVGFGVRDALAAKSVATIADAVVIGSKIVEEIENSEIDVVKDKLHLLISNFRQAIDSK